ncbi:hypothetical protein [Tsukamurella soli]|uniref:Tryptophan-associated transmembrane protein (Trp_oprn_chp) n=1 Tax=Tsukamurella soli TaxID=644556 RepID=A0ABP8J7B5_9ACTN
MSISRGRPPGRFTERPITALIGAVLLGVAVWSVAKGVDESIVGGLTAPSTPSGAESAASGGPWAVVFVGLGVAAFLLGALLLLANLRPPLDAPEHVPAQSIRRIRRIRPGRWGLGARRAVGDPERGGEHEQTHRAASPRVAGRTPE